VSTDAAGHLRITTEDSEVEWESHGTNYYIWCPHCAAKNIAIRMKNTADLPDLDIVAAVMEDE
jgi:hypothetical protein